MEVKDEFDHFDDGPQVVCLGRLHRITVECYVPENVTPEQITECISSELGWGGIGPDNPLFRGGLQVRHVDHEEDTGLYGYTLWEAVGERGKHGQRSGHTVLREADEPLGFEYTPPPSSQGE